MATLGLLAVTAAWGSTFFMLHGVVTRIPSADFLAVRFWIAALALFLVRPRGARGLPPVLWRRGLLLGLCFGAGQLLQTVGLEHTSAAVSGFVTAMYVVITPLLARVLFGQRLRPMLWGAVGLATAGLAVLGLRGWALGPGELLTLASAALYAAHIVGLGVWSSARHAHGLAVVQMLGTAAFCSVAAVPGGLALPGTAGDWTVLVYMALITGGLAMVVQTWAQAHLPATRTALLMTMEPVWAAGFALTLGAESPTWRLAVGSALMLAAMLLSELGPRLRPRPPRPAEDLGWPDPVPETAGSGAPSGVAATPGTRTVGAGW